MADATAESGTMLDLVPAWKLLTVTTAVSFGATSRATMLCRRLTTAAPSTIGSTPGFGIEPCGPLPYRVISIEAAAAQFFFDAVGDFVFLQRQPGVAVEMPVELFQRLPAGIEVGQDGLDRHGGSGAVASR